MTGRLPKAHWLMVRPIKGGPLWSYFRLANAGVICLGWILIKFRLPWLTTPGQKTPDAPGKQRGDEVLAALERAVEDIREWAAYADPYFREKHDLDGTIAEYEAVIAKAKEQTND